MHKSIHSGAYTALLRALRAAREQAGLTQGELATRIGETQSFVSKCERGERRLDVLEFMQVARALGADPIELVKRAERSGTGARGEPAHRKAPRGRRT